MEEGPKAMAAVALAWDGRRLRLEATVRLRANAELWAFCREVRARVLAIDGPCGTNGLRLRRDGRGWDLRARGGVRDAEAALAREGFRLFWTTHATVARFDGASRWIARSLRLFADPAAPRGLARIEVYPHGTFEVLRRALGIARPLATKATPGGRAGRLAILARLVEGISSPALAGHDAVDAAAAALTGARCRLGGARAVGTAAGGGRIWLPARGARSIRTASASPRP
jgi:predicted nuclease with RNAse H fold